MKNPLKIVKHQNRFFIWAERLKMILEKDWNLLVLLKINIGIICSINPMHSLFKKRLNKNIWRKV